MITNIIVGVVSYSAGMIITTLVLFAGLHWKEIVNEPDFGGNDNE